MKSIHQSDTCCVVAVRTADILQKERFGVSRKAKQLRQLIYSRRKSYGLTGGLQEVERSGRCFF
jgi:hypothetical protein